MDDKRAELKKMISAMTEDQLAWFIAQAQLLLNCTA